MSSTRSVGLPDRLVTAAFGVVLVLYVGSRLVSHSRRARRARERGVSEGENALRALVRQVGAQLEKRRISDEDELDAAIDKAKRKAYERRYTTPGRRSS